MTSEATAHCNSAPTRKSTTCGNRVPHWTSNPQSLTGKTCCRKRTTLKETNYKEWWIAQSLWRFMRNKSKCSWGIWKGSRKMCLVWGRKVISIIWRVLLPEWCCWRTLWWSDIIFSAEVWSMNGSDRDMQFLCVFDHQYTNEKISETRFV